MEKWKIQLKRSKVNFPKPTQTMKREWNKWSKDSSPWVVTIGVVDVGDDGLACRTITIGITIETSITRVMLPTMVNLAFLVKW